MWCPHGGAGSRHSLKGRELRAGQPYQLYREEVADIFREPKKRGSPGFARVISAELEQSLVWQVGPQKKLFRTAVVHSEGQCYQPVRFRVMSPPSIHLNTVFPQTGSKWPEKVRVCRSPNWRQPSRQERSSSMSLRATTQSWNAMDTPVLKTSTTGFLQRKIWRSTSRRFSTRLELIETEPLVVSAPTPKLVRIGTLGRGPMTPLVSGNSGLTVRLCVKRRWKTWPEEVPYDTCGCCWAGEESHQEWDGTSRIWHGKAFLVDSPEVGQQPWTFWEARSLGVGIVRVNGAGGKVLPDRERPQNKAGSFPGWR